jgi:hypothetical protein
MESALAGMSIGDVIEVQLAETETLANVRQLISRAARRANVAVTTRRSDAGLFVQRVVPEAD